MLLPIQIVLFWSQNFSCCGTRVTSSASSKSIPSTAKYWRIRTKTSIKTEYLTKFWDQYPPKNLYLWRLRFKSNSPTSIKYHSLNYNFRLMQKFKKNRWNQDKDQNQKQSSNPSLLLQKHSMNFHRSQINSNALCTTYLLTYKKNKCKQMPAKKWNHDINLKNSPMPSTI